MELSEYEIERRNKMERNHRQLQKLGLVKQGESCTGPMARTTKPQRRRPQQVASISPMAPVALRRKSLRTTRNPAPVYNKPVASAGVAVRKSLRTMNKPAPVYADDAVDSYDENSRDAKRSRHGADMWHTRETPQTPPAAAPTVGARLRSSPLAHDSSRNLECDIPMLMERFLGRRFPSFGKAPVMELSTKTLQPKFSRMSGVTEWKNAVFLWVNVDEGGGYANLFEKSSSQSARHEPKVPDDPADVTGWQAEHASTSPGGVGDGDTSPSRPLLKWKPPELKHIDQSSWGGRRMKQSVSDSVDGSPGLKMTWFAGGRMTAESALIQRLLVQQDPQTSEGTAKATPPPVTSSGRNGGEQGSSEKVALSGQLPRESVAVVSSESVESQVEIPQSPLATPNARRDVPKMRSEGVGGDHSYPEARARRPESSAEGGGGGNADAVLLFCRLPNEPYVFCGRVGYFKHWADERPVRFVWRLLDAERLARWPDFAAILKVTGVE